jgi:hypothetical protein
VRRTCLWCRPRRPVRVIARALSTWLADSKLDMAWRQTCGHYRRGNRIWRISGEKTINELASEADDVQTMVMVLSPRRPESWRESLRHNSTSHTPRSNFDDRLGLSPTTCFHLLALVLYHSYQFQPLSYPCETKQPLHLSTADDADPRGSRRSDLGL